MEMHKRVRTQITGKAGTYAVASELLFRDYIVQPMSIDAGIDLFCWKGNNRYDIQVKTATESEKTRKTKTLIYDVRKRTFDVLSKVNSFYVFVARMLDGINKFLVIPSHMLKKLIEENKLYLMRGDVYRVSLKFNPDDTVYLKGKRIQEDVSYYLNKWDLIS